MWVALDNCIRKVKPNGKLFIAIYNDQGIRSRIWWIIKYIYNYLPNYLKNLFSINIIINLSFCFEKNSIFRLKKSF